MSESLEPELHDLARALRGLTPASAPVNRDALLFEAGRASMLARFRFWRRLSVGFAGFASVLLIVTIALSLRPQPVRIVQVPSRAPVQAFLPGQMPPIPQPPDVMPEENLEAPAAPPGSYWQVREQVMRTGDLPEPAQPGQQLPSPSPEIPTAWSMHSSTPMMQTGIAEGEVR